MNDTDNRRCGTCGRVAFGGDVRRAPDGACCEEGGRACWRVTAAALRRENERLLATSQSLAETATALRRELAETHEKHAMEFQRADKYQAELAARTEELDAARKALRLVWDCIDDSGDKNIANLNLDICDAVHAAHGAQ